MNNKGFTLIELLVVVLIIGILAAVAVPQYQKAVLKSRFVTIRQAVDAFAKEFEMYYMANGSYPVAIGGWENFRDTFSIDMNGCTNRGDYLTCDTFSIDIHEHNNLANFGFARNFQYGYARWYANSKYPNRKECMACSTNKIALSMCQSFGGNLTRTVQYDVGCKMNAYEIP